MPKTAASTKPLTNVIVILADDLGYGDVGVYGGKAIPTPNIDALANGGIRYTDGYVTAAVCAPSRAALLAGRHQTRFGFEFNPVGRDAQMGMPAAEVTIAEMARKAGYSTAVVGKWHLGQTEGSHPLDQGFDSFYGTMGGATNYYPDNSTGIVTAETGADGLTTRQRFPILDGRSPIDPPGDLTDVLTKKALEVLRKSSDRPFFLYLALTAPHTPLQASQSDVRPFDSMATSHAKIYAALVTKLDQSVGRIVAELRASGKENSTAIIFLSDNGCPNYVRGACSNAPLSGYKAYPWEGGIRVPFILYAPGLTKGGLVQKGPVSSLDIMPTAARLMRTAPPKLAEGRDLLARAGHPQTLFWRMGPNYAVRHGRWKLLVVNKSDSIQDLENILGSPVPDGIKAEKSSLGQWELLFDLQNDPGEKFDLSAKHPRQVAILKAEFKKWDSKNVDPLFTSRRQFRTKIDGRMIQLFN